jgi:hypothetical protein
VRRMGRADTTCLQGEVRVWAWVTVIFDLKKGVCGTLGWRWGCAAGFGGIEGNATSFLAAVTGVVGSSVQVGGTADDQW